MTSQGEVYDNAIAESFFARLKCELIHQRKFNSLEELRSSLFEYIDGYYNTIRLHSSLGYKAPSEFEKMYYQKIKQNDKAIG
jgi:transposase InsO family protein